MARELLPDPNREYGQPQSGGTLEGATAALAKQKALNQQKIDEAKEMGELLLKGLTLVRAKNVRNLAETFSSRYIALQEIHLEGKEKNLWSRENFEEAFANFDWKMRFFGVSVLLSESGQALLSNLRSQDILDFDPMILDQIPRWAKIPVIPSTREPGEPAKLHEVLYFFTRLATEAKQPPKTEEKRSDRYGKIAELFTKGLEHKHAASLMIFFRTFFLAPSDDAAAVLKLNGYDTSQKILVKQMYELFDRFILDSFKSLIDDDDVNHQASIAFFRAFINSPVDTTPWEQRVEMIARGAMLRGVLLELDIVVLYRSLRAMSQDSSEPFYRELARLLEGSLLERQNFVPIQIPALRKLFPEDIPAEPVDWTTFKQNLDSLKLGDKSYTYSYNETDAFAQKTEKYSCRLKMIDGTLYAQFFFIHDAERVKNNIVNIDLDNTGFTTAIIALNLEGDEAQVYLNVIDDDAHDAALEAHFLSALSKLIEATLSEKQVITQQPINEALVSLAPVQIHTLATKGPQQMKRSNPARIQRAEAKKAKEVASVESAPRTFEEHVQQEKNKPKIFLTASREAQIEKDYPGYAERVKGKLEQANRGGGIVKTYSLVPGPRPDKPVWSIRLTDIIRILAQEGDTEKEATVFALLTHKEVEDLYGTK